jgi:RHS repeat-associated protein
VNVSVTFGLGGGTGTVTLTATSTDPIVNSATGRVDFTNVVAASASLSPSSYVVTQVRNLNAAKDFTLVNTGSVQTNFTLSDVASVCGPQLINCTRVPEALFGALPGQATGVQLAYRTDVVGTKSFGLSALFNGRILATSNITVNVVDATIAASPSTFTTPPSSNLVTYSGFIATNVVGSPTAEYTATITGCPGLVDCSFDGGGNTRDITLGPTPSAGLPITFRPTTPGSGAVFMQLNLKNGPQVGTTASVNVTIASAQIATFIPSTATVSAPFGASQFQYAGFGLRNETTQSRTFLLDFSPNCVGVTQCTFDGVGATTRTLTIAAQTITPVPVFFDVSSGATGTVTVRAREGATPVTTATLTVQPTGISVVASGTLPRFVAPGAPGQSQSFTVTNAGAGATFSFTHNCGTLPAPAAATNCSVSPSSQFLSPGVPVSVNVNFTAGSQPSGSTLTLTATGPATGAGGARIVVPAAVVSGSTTQTVQPGTQAVIPFTVTNTTPTADAVTYSYAVTCATQFSPCPVTVASSTLPSNGQQPVSVTFQANPGAQPGPVTLTARINGANGPIIAQATTTVTVQTSAVIAVTVVTRQFGGDSLLHRDQCVALGLGSDVASECGDLRVAHALPAVRTMGVPRAPTLLYTSAHARPFPVVPADLTLPLGASVPTSVTASLRVAGIERATQTWAGGQFTPGVTRRTVLGFDAIAAGLSTGVYPYVLRVVTRLGADSAVRADSGATIIVNRTGSAFGAGWWLAGLEQLDLANSAQPVWIGGDGSVRVYRQRAGSVAPNRVWGASSITYPDSIREVGGEFVRQLPDSVWVTFDAAGRHVRTRNRLGHISTFAYDGGGRLQSINVPPASSPLTYQFAYDGNGRLQTVTSPGDPTARTTTLTVEAGTGRITAVQDPGTPTRIVQFGYRPDGLMTSRTNGRGVPTTFGYDDARRVSSSTLDMAGTTPNIVRQVRNWQSQGLGATFAAAQRLRTVLTGPRGDTTMFVLNRLAAPDSIVDALSQLSRMSRTDPLFPGLVTEMVTPTGMLVSASYDTRGRLLTRTQPATTNVPATTSFQWHAVWDQLVRVTNPEGDYTLFDIAAATGNRLWQEDQRGAVSRVNFTYNAANQVEFVTYPNTSTPESYDYDVRGNLSRYLNALDHAWTYTNNGIGLTTATDIPTGVQVLGRPFERTTQSWSERNEELSNVRLSSTSTVRGRESISLEKSYDEEGNLLNANRFWSTGSGPLMAPLVTGYQYDRADRVTQQTEPDGSFATMSYDLAGNLTGTTTRRGNTLSMSYDLLNRLSTRTIPVAAPYTYPNPNIVPAIAFDNLPYGYSQPGETQMYFYHPSGQIANAFGLDADVSRTYHPNGALLTEVQSIRTRARTSTPHRFEVQYEYDRNGRRKSVRVGPDSVFSATPMTYSYYSWGALSAVTDIAGNSYGVNWTARGEVGGITFPGDVQQTLSYDVAGRLIGDQIVRAGSTAFPFPPAGPLRNFSVPTNGRNARGQILFASDPTLLGAAIPFSTFDGFGRITVDSMVAYGYLNDIGERVFRSRENITYNPNGDIIKRNGGYSLPPQAVTYNTTNNYDSNFRLQSQASTSGTRTWYRYDGAGSTRLERTQSPGLSIDSDSANRSAERAAYYSADDRLIASDARSSGRRTLEEYRYDALGRRVWVSTRSQCAGQAGLTAECLSSSVRRVVWDGTQELAEIQVPADGYVVGVQPGTEELNVGFPVVPRSTCIQLDPCDVNPFYGRVVYSPGLAIDQPLAVTRFGYRDNTGTSSLSWPTFTLSVFWNVRGTPAYGLFENGASFRPRTLGPSQTSCSLTAPGAERCVLVQWPFAQNAYDRTRGKLIWPSWHGSILRNKVDGTGLEYARNRVYDSQSGRFTQEDPIGLAGGMNLYGFADGDPSTYRDPFGLCPVDKPVCHWLKAVLIAAGTDIGFTAGGGAGLVAGPAAVAVSPALAAGGAAIGAAAGAAAGELAEQVFFAKKGDIKQVDAVARKFGIKGAERREFGDFLEAQKKAGRGGTANKRGDFKWKELVEKAKEFLGADPEGLN